MMHSESPDEEGENAPLTQGEEMIGTREEDEVEFRMSVTDKLPLRLAHPRTTILHEGERSAVQSQDR